MNYRVGSKREPVKRLQLRPGGLQAKYPSSLRPSPLRAWCWETVLGSEAASLAFAAWLQQRVRIGRQVIHGALLRLELLERASRYGLLLRGWLSRGVRMLWHGLVTLGRAGLQMTRKGIRVTVSQLKSRRIGFQERNESALAYPVSRFEAYATELRFPHLSSQPEQAFRRELAKSHAQLVEQLRTEEEELTRVATRVARLQGVIRAQERLLVEMTHSDENLAERNRFFEVSVDHLVGVGKTSDRDESRNMPLFRRN